MNRYCNDDDFALASANEVEVTIRYLETGRVVHTETIGACDLRAASEVNSSPLGASGTGNTAT